jgi:hypothetical protein
MDLAASLTQYIFKKTPVVLDGYTAWFNMNRHRVRSGYSSQIDLTITDWCITTHARDYWLHTFYQAMCITGIWMITSIYLMSSKTTLLTVYLILHITGIFTEALSFHTWLCICEKPHLKVFLGLSLTLQYWILICRSVKPASFKYFNRSSHRMHGCCCQLVFVIDVSLGYVQY